MKERYTLYDDEYKLMRMLMLLQPIKFCRLSSLCEKELGWKSSTTTSVINKLVEEGLIQPINDWFTSLVTSDQIFNFSDKNKSDGISSPAFVTYLGGKQLSETEAFEIIEIIEGAK